MASYEAAVRLWVERRLRDRYPDAVSHKLSGVEWDVQEGYAYSSWTYDDARANCIITGLVNGGERVAFDVDLYDSNFTDVLQELIGAAADVDAGATS